MPCFRASFFRRMACQREFLSLFFCYNYTTCALIERKNSLETLERADLFPGDGVLLFGLHDIGAEQTGSSRSAGELRSTPVIVHNMAVRVREQAI